MPTLLPRHGLEQLGVWLLFAVGLLALAPLLGGLLSAVGSLAVLLALVLLSRALEGRSLRVEAGRLAWQAALGLGLAVAALPWAAPPPAWALAVQQGAAALLLVGSAVGAWRLWPLRVRAAAR